MIGPRVRAGAVLLCVFAAGALAGTAVERHQLGRVAASVSLLGEGEVAITELRAFLDLDDEQVAQIHAILADNQHTVQLMWEQFRPEVQAATSVFTTGSCDTARRGIRSGSTSSRLSAHG